MAYTFNVKNNKVLFSNDVLTDILLFELEFITDAPKLCRKLREETKKIRDISRLIHTAEKIRTSFDGLEAPTDFRVRFCNPYNIEHDISIHIAIKEW